MNDEDETGELMALDDARDDVTETPDGGAIVVLEEGEDAAEEGDFYQNLAETMPEHELQRIGTQLIELIDKDLEDRKGRDKQYAEGIQRTGLGDDAPGGANFDGASKVVHPMLTEACIDFSARAIKELWPASGPVKTKIEGELTNANDEKADRKAALMNWQLTTQCREARSELEQTLTQVPLGGAQYIKASWNGRFSRPDLLAVMIDDMILPYAASSFYSCDRKTHREYLTQLRFDERVATGLYRDVDMLPSSMAPETSAADRANDKIEGRSANSYNQDGLRTVYTCYVQLAVEEDEDEPNPYIIHLDKTSNRVLAIYRNWEEGDDTRAELQWLVEFPFIPWRGVYPIGLPNIIGGLSAAATGALRALLDSAHIQNTPSGLKLKGATSGNNKAPAVGEILEVEGGLQTDDIRKLFMPMPYNQPSNTLMSLLSFIVDAARDVVRTSLDNTGDQNPNAPVGTTMANLEQAMVVYSAVHGRLHAAMGRVLEILHRLNRLHLDDEVIEKAVGGVGDTMASRADFQGPVDVLPVSDPNIYSEAQRFAQVQTVVQRADAKPALYNARAVEERLLTTLKIPNPDELLLPNTVPEAQNAVSENVAASLGKPIVAFPEQDHIAHLQTHLAFLTNPMLGGSPLFKQQYLPVIVSHIKEHIALWYLQLSVELAEDETGLNLDNALDKHEGEEDNKALDRLLAETSQIASASAADVFAEMMTTINEAFAEVQKMQTPPPMDPTQATVKVAEMQQQTKQQELQQKGQLAQQELQLEQQKAGISAQEHQLDAQGQQVDNRTKEAELQIKQQELAQSVEDTRSQQLQTQLDATKVELERMRDERDAAIRERDIDARIQMNDDDNDTAILIEQMKGGRATTSFPAAEED